jgi:hypothetical protein
MYGIDWRFFRFDLEVFSFASSSKFIVVINYERELQVSVLFLGDYM